MRWQAWLPEGPRILNLRDGDHQCQRSLRRLWADAPGAPAQKRER